ncbi:hypothetical protein GCM10007079_04700 [Nocardiopsis terrae]|nr:hypothetical protein GCM10007079_04700 [Nocardiopsis terrae]
MTVSAAASVPAPSASSAEQPARTRAETGSNENRAAERGDTGHSRGQEVGGYFGKAWLSKARLKLHTHPERHNAAPEGHTITPGHNRSGNPHTTGIQARAGERRT